MQLAFFLKDRRWLWMAFLAVLLPLGARAEDMTIEIVGGGSNQHPIAVVPFKSETSGVNEALTPTIKNDLALSGVFRMVPTEGVANVPFTAADVKYPLWQAAGAQLVAVGNVVPAGGQFRISFALQDVAQKKTLTSGQFTVGADRARDVAHTIANMIYEAVTGQKGIFNTRIVYVQKMGAEYHLQVADVDGGRARTVLRSKEPIISPSWSPDGNKLAYVSFETKKPVVWVQDLATGQRRMVANFKGSNSAPAWSPDGTRLAVTLTTSGNSQVYIVPAAGGSPRRLTHSSAIDTEPTWSPDGGSILFVSDRAGGPQIYRISANGGDAQRLTYAGSYNVSPKVSPDGKSFTYIRREGGRFRVMIQTFGNNDSRVLSEGSYNERPSYAPNGQMVLYASDQGGKSVLYAATTDGGSRVKLAVINGSVQDPAWGPSSNP